LHLEQVNRWEELKQQMGQTEAELHAARSAHDLYRGSLQSGQAKTSARAKRAGKQIAR